MYFEGNPCKLNSLLLPCSILFKSSQCGISIQDGIDFNIIEHFTITVDLNLQGIASHNCKIGIDILLVFYCLTTMLDLLFLYFICVKNATMRNPANGICSQKVLHLIMTPKMSLTSSRS